jgi:hypothetical protein
MLSANSAVVRMLASDLTKADCTSSLFFASSAAGTCLAQSAREAAARPRCPRQGRRTISPPSSTKEKILASKFPPQKKGN